MSVSDPGEKIEWGADSEPGKIERVPSSDYLIAIEGISSANLQS
jgi:hypothetical protein